MGAGEGFLGAGAVGVQRVFDDVVAGGADGVDEELALEGGEGEAGADGAAVDGEACGAGGHGFFPFRQHAAVCPEQTQPEAHGAGAIAGPVVGCDQAGVQAACGIAGVAEEGVVGGEVQTVQIVARVRQHGVGQPRLVEREHLHAGRHLGGDAGGDAAGVERGHQEGRGLGVGQVHQCCGREPGAGGADLLDVVDVDLGGGGHGRVQGPEGVGDSVGVVDGEAAGGLQACREGGGLFGGQWVGEGLVEDVAAGAGVEGLDVQHGHGLAQSGTLTQSSPAGGSGL